MQDTTKTGNCLWTDDRDDGGWFTSCGNAFEFTDGTPADNGMKFCCYCGRPLEEKRYEDISDDTEVFH